MRFKAVAFDVDGTLYPPAALNAVAIPTVLRHPLVFAAYGESRRAIRVLALEESYLGSPPADAAAFRRIQAELTASLLGGGKRSGRIKGIPAAPRIARIEALVDEIVYGRIPELFSRIRPFAGLGTALDRLAAAGLRLAALSDLPPRRKLELLGLGERFETALCSEDSGFLKPSPEPFRLLRETLGLEASDILYVGNSPAYDLAGAKAAGMAAAILSRKPVPGADLAFVDWNRLADFALS